MKEKALLSPEEKHLLQKIAGRKRCPVVRLELRSSRESSLRSTALQHIYLDNPEESMKQVKVTSALISSLEEKELLRADYDLFATLADYVIYKKSLVFRLLCELVEEGKKRPGCGKLTLTPFGNRVAEA